MAFVRLHNRPAYDWQRLALGQSVPALGPVLLALGDWLTHDGSRADPVGVWLDSDQGPEALIDGLARIPAIALHFPKFNDGRPYSTARILRDRLGYHAELIAVGDVLIDQVRHMVAVGFDGFEPRKGFSQADILTASHRLTLIRNAA